jgi:hypothetical protein
MTTELWATLIGGIVLLLTKAAGKMPPFRVAYESR